MSADRSLSTLDDRGQAQTLEAVSAGVLMLGSVVFALQVTTVTPLTASTTSQHIENQQAGIGEGLLDAAIEDGTLKQTLLYWNRSGEIFHGSGTSGIYTSAGPPTEFGERLNESLLQRGYAFDLTVHYVELDDDVESKSIVDMGAPTDHAVSVERTVVLEDDDPIYAADETTSGETLSSTNAYFVPDVEGSSRVYNVVRVELVIWRM
jgi:hypothetical protein